MRMERLPPLLRLQPLYQEKVWGGQRLLPDSGRPIGEAWIVGGTSVVADGPLAGATLDELAQRNLGGLVGQGQQADAGFPLLIKLLEASQWLSVQVHPDDELAQLLVGQSARGKTEAWYVIDAEPNAELLVGARPGVTLTELVASSSDERILNCLARVPVTAGDAYFIPAGTVHAIGPGVLIYEVQQMSDVTYRLYDWGRPQSAGRALHVRESLLVLERLGLLSAVASTPADADAPLIECPFFTLTRLAAGYHEADTAGRSFQAVTVLNGAAEVQAGGEVARLSEFDSVLLPASVGRHTLQLDNGAVALVVGLPPNLESN